MGLLILVASASVLVSLGLLGASVYSIRRKSVPKIAGNLLLGLLFLAFGALFVMIAIATQGYRALTREEIAAVVTTEPFGSDRFKAHFRFPNGERASFDLAGDELYVDAHILKWKPIANFLGLHTSYELDRVAGRYRDINDEQSKTRTVLSLAAGKPLDMFELRNLYPVLGALLDVEYGSATFGSVRNPVTFELRVSTTGLLLRKVEELGQPR